MKPTDYRHRIPPDPTESRLLEVVNRLGLFKDPTVTQPMFPVPDGVRRLIYDGVSKDGEGRAHYLKVSQSVSPSKECPKVK